MSHHHKSPPLMKNNIENTVVLESNIHGFGLFSTKKIKKDTLLCELSGQIITKKDFYRLYQIDIFPKDIFIETHLINENEIMITPFRTSFSFINNGKVKYIRKEFNKKDNFIKVYANIDIPENIEIVYPYDNTDFNIEFDILNGFNRKN